MVSKNKQLRNHPQKRLKIDPKKQLAMQLLKNIVYVHWERSPILIFFFAILLSYGHRCHLSYQFEHDRHFSHLSTLEREMGFRTEMGFYFSYFKTMVTAPSVSSGMYRLMRDNLTEYPSTINTLKRFNLYPELLIGCAYRVFESISSLVGHETKTCWRINRGEDMSPVMSCEGYGEPSIFYTEFVFSINGLMMGIFFIFGAYISDSVIGGLIAVASFMFNHSECTRVMWTPPLRESFGYPFFVLQMLLVTYVLKSRRSNMFLSVCIAVTQVFFMISWQFAQFALLTQTLAALATYFLKYTSSSVLKCILVGQTIGLISSFILLFGNEMIFASLFACCLIAVWTIVVFEEYFKRLKHFPVILLAQALTLVVITFGLKFALSKLLILEDDAHIGEILRSKFTDYKNFHTMLYTCAREFDYIEIDTIYRLLRTLLLPTVVIVFVILCFQLLKAEIEGKAFIMNDEIKENQDEHPEKLKKKLEKQLSKQDKISNEKSKYGAELVYHTFQLLAFTVMAVLIMRLKLFWTPHLCLTTALVASRKMIPMPKAEIRYAVIIGLVTAMAWEGSGNLKIQWNRWGEYSNPPQEQLIEWIKEKTSNNSVFAGAMPIMATVKLCTERPIVNHPHYEDAGLRARTKLVYHIYSRKPLQEVYDAVSELGVNYIILEKNWCARRQNPVCGMAAIWDREDEANRGKKRVCDILMQETGQPFFKRVFKNTEYQVFNVDS